MTLEIMAISGLAAVFGVAHVLLDTPIFQSASDGEVTGDLAQRDQEPPESGDDELETLDAAEAAKVTV